MAILIYLLALALAPSVPCCEVGGKCLDIPRFIISHTAYSTMMGCSDAKCFEEVLTSFDVKGISLYSTEMDMWNHGIACYADPSLVAHCKNPYNVQSWTSFVTVSLTLESLSVIILGTCYAYLLVRSTTVLPLFTPFLFAGIACCGALCIISPLAVYMQYMEYVGSSLVAFSIYRYLFWGKAILHSIVLLLISQSPNSVLGPRMGFYSSLLSTPLPLMLCFVLSTGPITHGLFSLALLSCWVALPFLCSELNVTTRQQSLTKEDVASRFMS